MLRLCLLLAPLLLAALFNLPARAKILWSDPASRVIHSTPDGTDILGGAVKRDDKSSDALYFKFHVDPLSVIRRLLPPKPALQTSQRQTPLPG